MEKSPSFRRRSVSPLGNGTQVNKAGFPCGYKIAEQVRNDGSTKVWISSFYL
ncbi:MAG: hypothetical protein HC803_05745 [Saprospiraceae bacterium]|nr:hypothetical protein [Saprospiraceae bacterium]